MVAKTYFTVFTNNVCLLFQLREKERKMKIAPVSMSANYMKKSVNFGEKKQEIKPLVQIDENTPDDKVVSYGTWGSNYVYPITAGQIRATQKENPQFNPQRTLADKETPEEYLARKIHSTEWTM